MGGPNYLGEPSASQEPTETSPLLGEEDRGLARTVQATSPRPSSVHDEESPFPDAPDPEGGQKYLDHATVLRIVLVLLIAVFVFNADHSLVLATHPTIASDFNALEWSSWLFTSFGLAGAATQSIFGKLSDIYGRKPIILLSYAGFAIGCIIVSISQTFLTVIIGRVISGSVGTSMTVLVTILITDLVPIQESGSWRAYVNVAATTGRSLGGPLGGWLADAVGWRWSFGIQAPMFVIAMFLCWINLPSNLSGRNSQIADDGESSISAKLTRVDFFGASVLGAFVLLLLLPLELGGNEVAWSHPLIPSLFAAAAVFLVLLVLVEKRWAKEPVLELGLFAQRDTVLSFLVMGFQAAAQLGMMFSVPLYFQVTQRASNSEAGAHLFPSVAGNALGGIVGGYFINRTGRYKFLVYVGTLSSSLCYILLLLRWHGETNWLEAFYIFPGGFGMGMAYSVLFVATQASVQPNHISAAVSTLFLSREIGTILGVASVSAVTKYMLQKSLEMRLCNLELDSATRLEIISKAVSNVDYALEAKEDIAKAVVKSYVTGLVYANGLSFCFVLLAFILGVFLREHKLQK
ncbi:major facilitator superfamily domain-containing protein [Mariannaea sp. PMI_226]|nr:major facilitator superfamily domain-containing protein [Mariannaea sp. PMI_226]